MSVLVVDASVVVKWFMPEVDSDRALLVRESLVEGECGLIAPDLMLSEFGNVLWKRRDVLDEATSLEMIGDLLALGITLVPCEQILAHAYRVARRYNCTVYDSLYLALAERRECDIITADKRLCNAVHGELPFVHWLGDWQPEKAG